MSEVRYVAIGDSFTEGVGDERADGTPRGWADLVAEGLAAVHGQIDYASMAVRGKLLASIVTEQLDAALVLAPGPTLLSLNGGGNDMLRPRTDLDALIGQTETAVHRCLDSGISVLLLAGPDPSARLPMSNTVHLRGEVLTAAVADLAERAQLTFVDVFHDEEIKRSGYWGEDRLHLNAFGHRRVANLVLAALGFPQPSQAAPRTVAGGDVWLSEVRYYRHFVLPWIGRRIAHRSSGDGRPPKHPTWTTITGGADGD
jgi:lysophospholipase L1-like esterase